MATTNTEPTYRNGGGPAPDGPQGDSSQNDMSPSQTDQTAADGLFRARRFWCKRK
jgi:hypothetical protein